MGMTAHVVFSDIDPLAPATTSATMVREVIRGFIGFQGLLMSDDIAMGALSGTTAERTQAALAAGCDIVLHCNGKLDGDARGRRARAGARRQGRSSAPTAALAMRGEPEEFDRVEGRKTFAALIAARSAGLRTARPRRARKARRMARPLGRTGRRRRS